MPAFQESAIAKGILQSPGLGGYGASIEQILDQAISFVTLPATRSEFIVIRFSHCPEPKKVLKEIKYYLDDTAKVNRGNVLQHISPGVTPSLGNTPISALRSKVALIFDESFISTPRIPITRTGCSNTARTSPASRMHVAAVSSQTVRIRK